MSGFTPLGCHPLIVEDDRDFTLLLMRGLEKVGIPRGNIRCAADGDAAITLLSEGTWTPSFVLLDFNMPGRTGLEVLEWIRSRSTPLAETLVFMLTSDSTPDHVARAFRLGVRSYFLKPFELNALNDVLEGIVTYWKSLHRLASLAGSLDSRGEGVAR